jgi:murein DD-endopeptidase MepM/ murein hydrolase activator NlpD
MRARVLAPLAVPAALAAGLATTPSAAQSPARASASAALVDGTQGRIASLASGADGRRSRSTAVSLPAARVRDGDLRVLTSRRAGSAVADASVVARTVSVLGGAVTAYGVRRRLVVRSGTRTLTGTVTGLKIDGRLIGTVTGPRSFELPDGAGSVRVNTGGAGLAVTLDNRLGRFPAGTKIRIATVAASARDGASPAAATPSATPTPTPRAARTPRPAATRAPARPRSAPRSSRARRPPAAARRRAPEVARRLTGRGFSFPVYGSEATAADDFGAARPIGAHEGNDVFAPFGAPVLAVTDGELFNVGTLPISGNRLWLRSKAGDEFFYAHLSAFSPAAVNGRRVKAGEVLGFTGNTGNAEPTPPHVHFEIHPGGGDAIDPHAILAAWRAKRDVPPGAWLTRYGDDTAERPGALVEVRDFIAGE